MGRIKKLDAATANGIAAGEVVERPSSVVKELVENAMDAGATTITVEIEKGGISLIRVTDNGCGMDADDASAAFIVHATSKLQSLEDLFDLHTMGFRGEALSSISAVSKVTLRTKQAGTDKGTSVVVEGGHILKTEPIGAQPGTSITVRDLFYNVPARYKFLKKNHTEAQYIATLIERFALIRTDISFRLLSNGKEILHTPGNDDPDATVYSIYGKNILDSCIKVEEKHENITIRGYVGRPDIARSNRSEQTIFVNERLIKSKTISSAIDEGYKTMLLKGKHAFIILCIYVPPNLVDVNVHPQKSEIRFWNDSELFRAVYHTIQNALLSRSYVIDYKTEPEKDEEKPIFIPGIAPKKEINTETPEPMPPPKMYQTPSRKPIVYQSENPVSFVREENPEYRIQELPFNLPLIPETPPISSGYPFTVHDLLQARIIGVLFRTYILLEWKGHMIMIDQHAAHEKVLFEELVRKAEGNTDILRKQPLLMPEMITLSAAANAFLNHHQEIMEEMGFDFAYIGERELILRGVPSIPGNPKTAFMEAMDLVAKELPETDEQKLSLLATAACKAAVKGHDLLHDIEIQKLLEDLTTLKNPYHCPHGRPIFVAITDREIQKQFKRIV